MALKSPENALRLKGTLINGDDVTSLSGTFPFGGTVLGLVSSGRFILGLKNVALKAEEHANAVFEILQPPQTAAIVAVLRSFDRDMLPLIFPNATTGSSSGDSFVSAGNNLPAASAGYNPGFPYRPTKHSFKLIFVPAEEVEYPYIIFYNAVPMVKEAAEVALSKNNEMQLGVAFQALPDANQRLYQWGKRGDLTVS